MKTEKDVTCSWQWALLAFACLAGACGAGPGETGGSRTPPAAGNDAGQASNGPSFEQTAGWSPRRRMRSATGTDVLVEEQLNTFTVSAFGASRIRRVDGPGVGSWNAPQGLFIEDAALHPSGSVSAVLVDAAFAVWLARLGPDLTLLGLDQLADPAIADDPFPIVGAPPPSDLTANALPRDSVRSAADGEEAVVVAV